jgi:hypothetical protein
VTICNAVSVGSQKVITPYSHLFGPLSPAKNAGDERTQIGGEGWGERLRQNAAGTANTTPCLNTRFALRIPRSRGIGLALPALAAFFCFAPPVLAAGPKIHIVIAAEADPLEQFAARELAEQLKKVYDADTPIVEDSPRGAENVILLGVPKTHAHIRALDAELPKDFERKFVIKTLPGNSAHLLVAGGSPRAVLEAAYELGWHFGVRYFEFGDLYPTTPKPFKLEGISIGSERQGGASLAQVTLDLSSPIGMTGAGFDEQARYLGQIAKWRLPKVAIYKSLDDAADRIASLRIPVDGDTAGRAAFAGKKFFENPDIVGATNESDRIAAAHILLGSLTQQARQMQFELDKNGPAVSPRLLPAMDQFNSLASTRDGWNGAPTAEHFAEILTPVCGDEVAARVQKAYAEATAADKKIGDQDRTIDVLDPKMLLRHYESDEPPPAWWGEVRTNYLNAMNEMYRANTRAREGGRQFTLWYARQFEFGMEYMNVVEALRKAGIAKRKGNKDEQIAELEKALDSITGACNAIAATARSQSDRGVIAVMNEYGYRPVTKLLEEADAEN